MHFKKVTIEDWVTLTNLNSGSFTGSFSGSFIGNGTNLTGVTAEWDGSHFGDASITGSFTVSGSDASINFLEAENGTSGSFSGSYSGSYYGDGSGITGVTNVTASYITSSGVDGPYGMNSILSASHAITSSYVISSSNSDSSTYSLSSSNSLTASYYDGNTLQQNLFYQTGSFYATTNTVEITGSLGILGGLETTGLLYNKNNTTDTLNVKGPLVSNGEVRKRVTRKTIDNSNYTISSTDNIIYLFIASNSYTNNIITLPNDLGRSFKFLVRNPNNHN